MADASMIFDWLAILAIGLMSVTIPTYAISVSFMGRERKRAIFERERRVEELRKKIKDLIGSRPLTDPVVISVQTEINDYEKEIKKIRGRVDPLSVRYACFIPLGCFMLSLFIAAYGFLLEVGNVTLWSSLPQWFTPTYFGGIAILFLLLGVVLIANTLIKINEAAEKPETLTSLRLSFASGSTTEKFIAGQKQPVGFILQNLGKELGEKITAQIYFPDEFGEITPGLSGGPLQIPQVIVSRQPTLSDMTYPNRMTAGIGIGDLYEDAAVTFAANITMPKYAGTYKVPANLWERRLGKSEQELTFEITPSTEPTVSPNTG